MPLVRAFTAPVLCAHTRRHNFAKHWPHMNSFEGLTNLKIYSCSKCIDKLRTWHAPVGLRVSAPAPPCWFCPGVGPGRRPRHGGKGLRSPLGLHMQQGMQTVYARVLPPANQSAAILSSLTHPATELGWPAPPPHSSRRT
jgi:hypothetical protein